MSSKAPSKSPHVGIKETFFIIKSDIPDYYIGLKTYYAPMSNDRSVEEKKFLKALGKAVISLSAKKKKSLERIAYEAGVSKGYIYDIANGKANPSIVIIHRISNILDISVWELLKHI